MVFKLQPDGKLRCNFLPPKPAACVHSSYFREKHEFSRFWEKFAKNNAREHPPAAVPAQARGECLAKQTSKLNAQHLE